ncbi:hypothetical protein M438DRAFT_392351 [Aureobasidium pullulans EXF-150]|uniref:Uncharacterized protein n=1 Tax=Aureobasidium pullulans EXF-150 TaxID=1043002 RepID=A0A074XT80_AURPU|nr:uncharacterized protein M438DRAFT_392351 [Aureobasidium pullulans EXF-150]KEQ85167.1 hypothetical protein M438DRAFT_392351 [Aureobasidium pullulans EXF-150]
MPDKHTVAQRYLAQVNNIISVGEALVQTDHVSESGIIYLRKALDSVYDVLQDNAIELGAKATKNDGDTEDEESEVEEESIKTTKRKFRGDTKCLLEKATVWPPTTGGADNDWATKLANYMRSVGDGVTSIPSRALQELLLLSWSGQGLDNVQSLAHETRENAATIQSTLALNVVGKERTTSDFSDMASAITRMLQIRTAGVLSQIDSIVVHAVAARVMESTIGEIGARSGPLFKAYKEATSVEDHSYGNEGTRDSYRLFVIEKAIPVVYQPNTWVSPEPETFATQNVSLAMYRVNRCNSYTSTESPL